MENLLTCRIKAMFDKIEEGDASYYNDLAEIVYGFLKPRIRAWCSRDSRLKGKQLEDDLLNDAYLIISKKIVTHFLRRNGFDAPINNDPEGFLKWMTTVAANHVKNEAEKQGRRQTVSIEPPEDDDGATRYEYKELSTEDFDAEIDSKRELISSALDVVLDKRSEPYIILSWLTVSIYVLENNVQNHVAIRMIVDEMSDKTLFEIKDRVFEYSDRLTYFGIGAAKKRELEEGLAQVQPDGRRKGEMLLSEVYMNDNGRGTLSRWVSRINDHVRARVNNNEASNR